MLSSWRIVSVPCGDFVVGLEFGFMGGFTVDSLFGVDLGLLV
jgi:hypothetical protein